MEDREGEYHEGEITDAFREQLQELFPAKVVVEILQETVKADGQARTLLVSLESFVNNCNSFDKLFLVD